MLWHARTLEMASRRGFWAGTQLLHSVVLRAKQRGKIIRPNGTEQNGILLHNRFVVVRVIRTS